LLGRGGRTKRRLQLRELVAKLLPVQESLKCIRDPLLKAKLRDLIHTEEEEEMK